MKIKSLIQYSHLLFNILLTTSIIIPNKSLQNLPSSIFKHEEVSIFDIPIVQLFRGRYLPRRPSIEIIALFQPLFPYPFQFFPPSGHPLGPAGIAKVAD